MSNYATVSDIVTLKRPLSAVEQTRAEALIPLVCDAIRYEAQKVGKNFDEMVYVSKLGTQYDTFDGNGTKRVFELTDKPVEVLFASVNGAEVNYTLSGNNIEFENVPDVNSEVMIAYTYRILLSKAKAVVADVIMRELNTPATQMPATQYSESAGNVSQSYTIPNSSGRIALWASDLKSLGLKRQKIGSISMMR